MSESNVTVDDQTVIDKSSEVRNTLTKEELEETKSAKFLKDKKNSEVMSVKVYSPFKVYYDAPAFSISAENLTGAFDILPKHHSFISLLTASDLIIRTPSADEKSTFKLRISGGLIHVKANQVIVFLDV